MKFHHQHSLQTGLDHYFYADAAHSQLIGELPNQAAIFDFPASSEVERFLPSGSLPLYLKINPSQNVGAILHSNYGYAPKARAGFYPDGIIPPDCADLGEVSVSHIGLQVYQDSICTFTSVSPANFGVVPDVSLENPIIAIGEIGIKCNAITLAQLTVSKGLHYDSDRNRRRMSNGEQYIDYWLKIPANLQDLPDHIVFYNHYSHMHQYQDVNLAIHAQTYPTANANMGTYSDTVVITLTHF